MIPSRGDVVWGDDPFKHDPDPGRPWLVLNSDGHPFADEQSIAVALSTSGHVDALPIPDDRWLDGGTPRRSYVLPWSLHSPQSRYVEFRQGRLDERFVSEVSRRSTSYIDPD